MNIDKQHMPRTVSQNTGRLERGDCW